MITKIETPSKILRLSFCDTIPDLTNSEMNVQQNIYKVADGAFQIK